MTGSVSHGTVLDDIISMTRASRTLKFARHDRDRLSLTASMDTPSFMASSGTCSNLDRVVSAPVTPSTSFAARSSTFCTPISSSSDISSSHGQGPRELYPRRDPTSMHYIIDEIIDAASDLHYDHEIEMEILNDKMEALRIEKGLLEGRMDTETRHKQYLQKWVKKLLQCNCGCRSIHEMSRLHRRFEGQMQITHCAPCQQYEEDTAGMQRAETRHTLVMAVQQLRNEVHGYKAELAAELAELKSIIDTCDSPEQEQPPSKSINKFESGMKRHRSHMRGTNNLYYNARAM